MCARHCSPPQRANIDNYNQNKLNLVLGRRAAACRSFACPTADAVIVCDTLLELRGKSSTKRYATTLVAEP